MVRVWLAACAAVALFGMAPAAQAQMGDFVPPAGFSGAGPVPAVATPAEPGTPPLVAVAPEKLAGLVRLDPDYRSRNEVQARVIGAYTVEAPRGTRFVEAWSTGFLPVNLAFSDGSCFRLGAEYTNGKLGNARLKRSDCNARRPRKETGAAPPAERRLRAITTAWGYDAWADDRHGTTLVTAPRRAVFTPIFSVKMKTLAFMAMNSIDAPLGNVTLVGRIGGKLTIVTLLVTY